LSNVARGRSADAAAVVASQGHYDEEALEAVLNAGVPYVGLVASRKRGATVRSLLEGTGVPGVAGIRIPAGLDLGGRTAQEVALSILAEIVQSQASHARQPPGELAAAPATSAIDPVCGMSVEVATARHVAEVDGASYYFCCAQCRVSFLASPQAYLARS